MESFSHEQRSQVLKFVTGRSRLPVAFKVEWQPDSDQLPRAATCFQKIYLPRYPSFAKMREKMLVAIQCMSIDTD
jgi:E3 ubiquitin-protein ligase NEDD4